MTTKMYVLFTDLDKDQVYAIYTNEADCIADLDAMDDERSHYNYEERLVTIHAT